MNGIMPAKKWLAGFFSLVLVIMVAIMALTAYIDPFFHYHKPLKGFFYRLNNERYQNDGIVRHFDYNAIITGTSMNQNFKASEVNKLFKCKSVKTTFSGGSYKEINDNLAKAYVTGHKVKYVFRSVDYATMIKPPNLMRNDLGVYPEYLYNDIWYDDIEYLLNKDVVFRYIGPMLRAKLKNRKSGITSFDEYSSWQHKYQEKFGKKYILGNKNNFRRLDPLQDYTKEDKQIVEINIKENILALVKKHPETQFYFFFPPHSIAWWGRQYQHGSIDRFVDAEANAVELFLECPNVNIYCFGEEHKLVNNLKNYKDYTHYGEHINSYILKEMQAKRHKLTRENYKAHIEAKREYYNSFDYESIFKMPE